MLEITSVSNQQVKDVVKLHQKKYRNEKGLFLLEGHKPISEAFASGVEIEAVYVTQKHIEKFSFVSEKLVLVSDAVIEKISTTDSPAEAVAVAKQKVFEIDAIKNHKRIALLENVKDAGNLGTIIRSAAAFGIDAIVLCGDTIDIFNPKVVRSTVGAMFKLPVVKASLDDVCTIFSMHNFVATVVNHKDVINPYEIDYKKPFVLMFGSEADGLTPLAIEKASTKTTIPMTSQTESLNLSVAASVLFFVSSKDLF